MKHGIPNNKFIGIPEEVPLAEDVKDWEKTLTKAEKNLLTQIFRSFVQADVEVNNYYMKHYSQVLNQQKFK